MKAAESTSVYRLETKRGDFSLTLVVALDISIEKKKLIQVTMFEAKNKTDRLRDFISKRKFET